MNELDLGSLRARRARLAKRITPSGYKALVVIAVASTVFAVICSLENSAGRIIFIMTALATLAAMLAAWYKIDLSHLPPKKAGSLTDRLAADLLGSFKKGPLTPAVVWQTASHQWQGQFLLNHLLLDSKQMAQSLGAQGESMPAVWQKAIELSDKYDSDEVGGGALVAALLISSDSAKGYLAALNLRPEDVLEALDWQERLSSYLRQPKPYFGGFGRDWAAGFTPTLDRYGQNISRAIEAGQAGHYHTLAHGDVLDSVIHNLSQGSGALALVGDASAGKTSLTYALAQRLLEGRDDSLRYYQVINLNASQIISGAGDKLERIMLTLFGEAMHARNVILFLDDAKLFFSKGTGAFDLGQVLAPLLQNRSVKIISAFTPHDFQQLKTSNEALAAGMAVINIKEPEPDTVTDILEDTALTIEQRDGLLVSFQAVREAYQLSGQYYQDLAYPGKAINLLEQAIPYAEDKVMSAASVQAAVEKTKGVKVSKADAPESDKLLHLEDLIHQRMINQERAVKVVASALRRGRAGVSNPKRPVGTFLFLGPTGVGKTELARSLAAAYFGDEQRMIRLDMSEYQGSEDVERLLDSGTEASKTLLLSVREQPFSVILLDELEKANPAILNLLLQMLDEGQLTDKNGKPASFKNAIVICTSNAGSAEISQRVASGDPLDSFERPLIEKLIGQGLFKPELVNRFDEVVLFRPLNEDELAKVALLMLAGLNKNLAKQNITVQLTKEALVKVVQQGYDPEFGARPMSRTIQKLVEDTVANRILSGEAKPGSTITLDAADLG